MRSIKGLLAGIGLGLYLSAPVYAFTPSESPLLSAAAVAPNVMLLVDNSGSMYNIVWATGFDPDVSRVSVSNCSSSTSCLSGDSLEGGNISLSSLNRGGCSSGWVGFYRGLLSRVCLKLPDPVGSGATRYTADYLSYLVTLSGGVNRDYTTGSIPNDYRINVAREVSKTLINNNRSLRMGLASVNPPRTGDRGPGGNIQKPITDLSVVPNSVTQAQADANYNALITAINGLDAEANTPLAETYYDVSRYFRGLAPYYNSTPSTYTSPIQYRCQKNYGVVITDGLLTYDRTFPSNDPDGAGKLPNWDGVSNDGADPSGDSEGDTLYLDDIAKFGFDIDMRKTGNDAAGKSWNGVGFEKQNLNTYTVGFAVSNDMLSDAAHYGNGQYYQANDSAALSAALASAIGDINAKAGSGGGGATSSATLQSDTRFYLTLYDPKDWRGTIKALTIDSTGSVNATSSTPVWTTDTTMVPGSTSTTFQSWRTDTNKPITLAFANFSDAQKTVLGQNLPTGISATDLVEWTKGTHKAGLKVRSVLLGDVINSPLVAALPSDKTASDLVGDTSYSSYLTTKQNGMTSSLVVNANDGFMQVLNASNGARRYAYMPSTVLPSLYLISDVDYKDGQSHKFTVDGQVAVFDAQFGSTNTAWKTVALGGVGGAGKAYYAVQLYDATAGNTAQALWEIRAPDVASAANAFNDLGYAYSRPAVARLADGTWAAFIGNGYGSNTGVAALYVVDIRDGSLIKKIVIDATEKDNGLSSVKLKVNAQNVVQAAYGGDLKGRMWKFDLSSTSTTSWGLAFSGKPLFTASGGVNQPISAQPLLLDHPTNGKLVYFGTGKFNEAVDKLSTARQAFYAIWDADNGAGNYTESQLQAQSITGVFTGSSGEFITTSENDVGWASKKGWYLPLVYNSLLKGERVIYPAQTTRGRIVFTTAAVDTSDPCESSGTGKLVELDPEKGKMLSYAVLDTNGDGFINTGDTRASGINFGEGVPNLAGILSHSASSSSTTTTSPYVDYKTITLSNGTVVRVREKGASEAAASRRIMWRQIM
ncbi:pilus assembly protein [Pseudomonas sp. R5(2019)]|uniref:pilus assembly protein n=1 Tax=Pseudomonas sp. R5(2019) TaxID=2697566 RepID=UPI0014133507|nr:PilC/PilY family type IV pilus protein [Pseudomonas sp. R5(2019)]NBA96434.1 pilus assembly protein [Pseudomonas sp. R5(2019)]